MVSRHSYYWGTVQFLVGNALSMNLVSPFGKAISNIITFYYDTVPVLYLQGGCTLFYMNFYQIFTRPLRGGRTLGVPMHKIHSVHGKCKNNKKSVMLITLRTGRNLVPLPWTKRSDQQIRHYHTIYSEKK
jgi:hypothetical protein